ncbi:MAG: cytosine permease [[Clostridium] nexile]
MLVLYYATWVSWDTLRECCLLSYVVCPVGGVILADYWVVGKGKAKNFRPQDGVNWAGVIAWALGAIISYTLVKLNSLVSL